MRIFAKKIDLISSSVPKTYYKTQKNIYNDNFYSFILPFLWFWNYIMGSTGKFPSFRQILAKFRE